MEGATGTVTGGPVAAGHTAVSLVEHGNLRDGLRHDDMAVGAVGLLDGDENTPRPTLYGYFAQGVAGRPVGGLGPNAHGCTGG